MKNSRKKTPAPGVTEEQVQRTILDGLTAMGYTVLQTSHRTKRVKVCASCRTKNYVPMKCNACSRPLPWGYGATPGVPDLIVSHKAYGQGVWVGLEVKGPKTAVSEAQRKLRDAGHIHVVRSWEDAKAAMLTSEREAGACSAPIYQQGKRQGGTI
jgi:hypothetical protein